MTDPQEPNQSPEQLKSPPPPPMQLDYGHGDHRKKQGASTGGQVAMGFLLWVLALGVFFLINSNRGLANSTQIIGIVEVCAVIAFALFIRIKLKWRGFIPGVLLGFGLTCLVPIGIVAVVCGNWKF